jgi:hypothetical protein
MMHHPFDWLRDRVDAERYLNSRARILITGHEHRPSLTKIEHDTGIQQVQLAAGSTTPPAQEKSYNFSFNWIELSWVGTPDNPQLAVTVYPRAWSPTETRFTADRARLREGASRTISLDCEPYRPAIAAAPIIEEVSAEMAAEALPVDAESETLRLPDTDEVASSLPDPDAFEKLRFLFWRYLNRQERLNILIELGLLTEAARARLPSAIERQAFEDAFQLNRLEALWDRTMPSVPEAERGSNPFGGQG